MRTTFTEEQVQILQANFQIDSNPDGQDLERIAQITGLSKRVTQVSNFISLKISCQVIYRQYSSIRQKKLKLNLIFQYDIFLFVGLVSKLPCKTEKIYKFW